MSNVATKRLDVSITAEVYDALIALTERQNAHLGNNVSRLLNEAISATYERRPALREPRP